MARIHELIRQLRSTNEALANDIEREFDVLSDRRAFGLNFERHTPEVVELPRRRVRVGDKVHVLPPRGETPKVENKRLWRVVAITGSGDDREATLEAHPAADPVVSSTANVADLVVVAEFRDPIYPGLVSTGKVERGGDKPYHSVINGENFHALQTLLFTHRGMVDLVYIDPPYNTGNEWIYNDKYVADNDLYRHSKWLAFLERRLKLARELLAPRGVLCVSIGSDEMHRLKLLVEQTLPELTVQAISVQTTAGGKATAGVNTLHDYLLCATREDFVPQPTSFTGGVVRTPWEGLILATFNRAQRPNQAYPIFIDQTTGALHSIGSSITELKNAGVYRGRPEDYKFEIESPAGTVAIWPITTKGEECVWRLAPDRLAGDWVKGYIKISPNRRLSERNQFSAQYLPAGVIAKVVSGEIPTLGREEGVPTLRLGENQTAGSVIPSIWTEKAHRTAVGNDHLKSVLGHKRFPYPKPVPFVADVIRGFAESGEHAVVLDFFGGSGTTAEAVMALNAADGGARQCILVTNNEVSADDSARLQSAGLRRGDPEWEDRGVFEFVAKPRILTVTTGVRGDGFRFSDGFEENVEFFTLTYEAPIRVQSHREFGRIAPLLWLRAGSRGRRIESLPDGWDVVDSYGVIADLDRTDEFLAAIAANSGAHFAFIVTDEDRLFEAIVRDLPLSVEPVRLYASYLRNFEIDAMRSMR